MASALTCPHTTACTSPCPTPPSLLPYFLGSSYIYGVRRAITRLGSNHHHNTRTAASTIHALWSQPQKSQAPVKIALEAIVNEAQFDSVLSVAQQESKPVIVDWMAEYCRKCIYVKPKLEKLAAEFVSDVKFYYVDVNAVPQAMVKRAEVTKMPTIQLWKNGEKCDEVIGGHKAWVVMEEVREMIHKHLKK